MRTTEPTAAAGRWISPAALLALGLGWLGVVVADAPAVVDEESLAATLECEVGAVRLTQSFAGAPRSRCVRTGPAEFRLTITPEKTDINPSPWYAFELHGVRSEGLDEAHVVLEYAESRHRYRPKRRAADGGWKVLPDESVRVAENGVEARLRIPLAEQGHGGLQRVAAQELLDVGERRAWRRALAERAGYSIEVIGWSVRGRPIERLLRTGAGEEPPLVVVLGGQHPPEVPGVLGQRAFLQALHGLEGESAALIDRIEWLVIPNLNPDGVERGYWRLNAGGVDLNRDWGPFTQPETRAARAAIDERIRAGSQPILLLDFHATRRDVLYLPEQAVEIDPTDLAGRWTGAIRDRMAGDPAFPYSRSHGVGRPTAKTWFADTFGMPGITVEFGDETARSHIDRLAAAAADALAEVLAEDGH